MVTTIAPGSTAQQDIEVLREAAAHVTEGSQLRSTLESLVATLARGAGAAVLDQERQLSPNEAAQLLGMSRPHLLSFMNAGALTFTRVGSNRRIALTDLLDFAERRRAAGKFVAEALGNASRLDAERVAEVAPISDAALADLDDI